MSSSQPVERTESAGTALVLLILLLIAVALQLSLTGQLEAVRVADTPSYMEASRLTTLRAALSTHRTLGFPTLIRTLYRFGWSTQAIPTLALIFYSLGVLVFFIAVLRFTGSTWLAFAASVPLPFAGLMSLISLLQPDFLSGCFVLLAISCLLLVVVRPRNWLAWIGLGLSVSLAYQFRPAAQLLVVLVPVLAGTFLWLREGTSIRRILRLTAVTAAVTLVPFLMFCALRAVSVGNFGLVSFGGSNVAASVVNFLDRELVEELPAESHSMARRILQQRRKRGWEPMRLDSDPIEYFRQGSENLFRIARDVAKQESRKAARRAGTAAPDPQISINVDLDRRLTVLATQIIRRRPILYLNWIRHAMTFGMRQLFDFVWIVVPFSLILISLPIAWLSERRVPQGFEAVQSKFHGSQAANLVVLAILAFGYFLVYLVLVSCTYFPFDRYFVSLTLFLPSALVACLYVMWQRILRSRLRD